ncbi:ABC transporter substrate-binding protein [Actinomycetospora corticicola]|uniref:NitT/TauT family transport system substrate-binding protein n=1 Tax=Actinomycetospora corticicola TaxID=663602 RepID=A0A7Y9J3I5_9PSEU|nr:ABC transporter substrate-binding protein [Actinomycetospora corticicola]NYD34088.1 NitT/TauT family transport system substrate-binding protein [Actinomycetospora corticicola]
MRPIRMSRSRVLRALAVALAAVAVLTACGGAGDTTDDGRQRMTFLNILPLESLSYSAELIADTKGFFAARGLDVTFETTQGSAPAIQTVLAGSAEITRIGDIETMIAAGKRGAPLVAVGEAIHRGTLRMVSARDDAITEAGQFRGKLVGTPSEGGTSSITLDLVAGSAGVPPAEVRRQVVGLAPGVFDLLTTGRIDAYIVSLDTSVQLQRTRPEAVVYDPNSAISAGAQVYATSRATAQDPAEQDKLRRYMAAIDDAVRFIAADQATGFQATMASISSKYQVPALGDPETAREALRGYVASYTGGETSVGISPQRWERTYQEIAGIGQLPPGLDPAQWLVAGIAPTGTVTR